MRKWNRRYVLTGVVVSFVVFVALIAVLARRQLIGAEMATLMLVALFGLYVGFGILLIVYRLILKLD